MNNNENNKNNNNLDMNQPMNEIVKEYYVKKIEKYEELNERENKKLFLNVLNCALLGIIILMMNVYDIKYDINQIVYTLVSASGISVSVVGIRDIAASIAKKAGLESRINEIDEKFELWELQNKQNNNENSMNYEEEKGRSL